MIRIGIILLTGNISISGQENVKRSEGGQTSPDKS